MTTHTARHRRTGLDRLRVALIALAIVGGLLMALALITAPRSHATTGPSKPNPAWTCIRVPSAVAVKLGSPTWCYRTRTATGPVRHPATRWPVPSPKPTTSGSTAGTFVPAAR